MTSIIPPCLFQLSPPPPPPPPPQSPGVPWRTWRTWRSPAPSPGGLLGSRRASHPPPPPPSACTPLYSLEEPLGHRAAGETIAAAGAGGDALLKDPRHSQRLSLTQTNVFAS